MSNIIKMSDHTKKNLFDTVTHDTIPLFPKLQRYIQMFNAKPGRPSRNIKAPSTWNPTFFFSGRTYDPLMWSLSELVEDESEYFTPRSGKVAMQSIIEIFDHVKEQMHKTQCHTSINSIDFAKHYIVTKEDIDEKSIVIGFFYLKDSYFERFLIKDKELFLKMILTDHRGEPSIVTSKQSIAKTMEECISLVSSANEIPITDTYIKEMLNYFNVDIREKVVNLF